ncbi:putative secreted protein (Por secretion system target) [Lutibacter sp. Hel_I_33_5]|uniref:tandem-95 repeat protein n=1 Tax=Lutibacter sp. Hel_I_33_5 TaxID=1566289 RepID=UPI00119FE500|nr:tandem-95 repeat protein [Lutibacter sp. Hel_I_33_5]TVZ56841.1 putative secreted protein (Por secretion system target) [Lutibacter sp. Hel_I_33_5]
MFNATCTNALTYVPDDNLERYLETHDANGVFVGHGAATSMGNITSTVGPLVLDNHVFTNRINTVTKLEVPSLMISDMTGIQDFAALQRLECSNNTISNLDLSSNTALNYVKCEVNQITNLNVTNSPNLNFLACPINMLPALDVTQNPNLTILDCDTNKITNLDVTQNPKLYLLDAQDNLLTALDVSQNPLLFTLVCSSNQIPMIDVRANTKLNAFNCRDNLLTNLDLSLNTDLEILDFSKNSISSINLVNNLKLKILSAAENLLSNLDVHLNTSLHNLTCNNNPNLSNLNIANGNNASFTFFQSMNNPLLTCIKADAATPAIGLSGWYKDPQHMFSTTCAAICSIVTTADTNSTLEDTALTVAAANGVLANDTAGSCSLTVTQYASGGTSYSAGSTATLTEGTIIINADGSYTFTPAADFCGAVPQITYTTTDGTTTSNSTLDISVTCVNDAPVAVNNTMSGVPCPVATIPTIHTNDTDVDGTLDLTSFVLIDSSNASNTGNISTPLIVAGVGTFTINTLGYAFFNPVAGFTGAIATVNYTVKDNDGATSNIATLTFNLTTNLAAYPDTNTTNEDTSLTVTAPNGLLVNDTGSCGLSVVDFSVGGTTYTAGSYVVLSEGSLIINFDGSYSFIPTTNFCGVVPQITYKITDGLTTATSSFDITVTCINDAPIAIDDVVTTSTNTPVVISVKSNDTDVENDPLTVSPLTSSPTNGTIVLNSDGTITYTPNSGFTGTDSFTYTVCDPSGACDTATVTVTIAGCTLVTLIPDVNFEQALINQSIDSDGVINGQVCTADINTIKFLDVRNLSIRLMTGIEDFRDIEQLYASKNLLTSIDVTQNLNLIKLVLGQNQITGNLNVRNNRNLELLTCDNNLITTLDVTQNIKLKGLHFSNNKVPTIDVTNLSDLEVLTFDTNLISNLDVSQNLALIDLVADNNLLPTINVTNNRLLTRLACQNNMLTSLDVTQNTVLETLAYGDNNISSIDLSQNSKIKYLFCYRNGISTIDLSSLPLLEALHCRGNILVDLDLSIQSNFVQLFGDSNKLTRLNIANGNNSAFSFFEITRNPDLKCVQADAATPLTGLTGWTFDPQTSFSTDCSSVWSINVSATTLAALLSVIPSIDISPSDGVISLAEAAAYTGTLDLSGTGITDVEGLQAFTGITTLDVSGNGITDLSPLTGLVGVTINSRTTGETKNVSVKAMALETLIIKNNKIENVNLDKLSSLKEIDLSDNPDLVTVSLKNGANASITSFNASNTPLLTCIMVDDINASYLTNWTKDDASTFVTDAADCTQRVLSVSELDLQSKISIYPNPVKSTLTVQLKSNLALKSIEVYNLVGKRVMISKEKEVNLSTISNGMYLVKVITDKGIRIQKIVKE